MKKTLTLSKKITVEMLRNDRSLCLEVTGVLSINLSGDVSGLSGDVSGLSGDVSGLSGHVSGLSGYVSGLSGDGSGLRGDVSGLSGDVHECEIMDDERENGINIKDLIV